VSFLPLYTKEDAEHLPMAVLPFFERYPGGLPPLLAAEI